MTQETPEPSMTSRGTPGQAEFAIHADAEESVFPAVEAGGDSAPSIDEAAIWALVDTFDARLTVAEARAARILALLGLEPAS